MAGPAGGHACHALNTTGPGFTIPRAKSKNTCPANQTGYMQSEENKLAVRISSDIAADSGLP